MKIHKRNRGSENTQTPSKYGEGGEKIPSEERVDLTLTTELGANLAKFKALFAENADIIFREFRIGVDRAPCAVVYVEGITDTAALSNQLLRSLIHELPIVEQETKGSGLPFDIFEEVKMRGLTVGEVKEADNLDNAVFQMMTGMTVFLIDGYDKVLLLGFKGWQSRGVTEPQTETVIRGPRDGFTETLRVNTALLRRKYRDPNMIIENMQIGRRTKTDVSIVYVKGITTPQMVEEVRSRLQRVDIDIILDSGKLEQLIQDNYLSPFPQVQPTERPDKVIAAIAEGRVGILVDNSPFALIVPAPIAQFFQSSEDFYERWLIGSLLRILRWIGFFLATFLPAIYLTTLSFHPGMLPTGLVLSMAAAREGVPFPAIVEVLLMEITIELLREAGARLPKPIGQTIGIVGGIIIGDAAVRAGITSPITVIVVAVTAIASFIIPSYNAAVTARVLRFPIMIAGAILGIYGVMLGFIVVFAHMVALRTFGVNYLTPFAPMRWPDLKDSIIRMPTQTIKKRPEYLEPLDIVRQK